MAYRSVPVSGRIVYDTTSARKTSASTNAGSGLQFDQERDANIQKAMAAVDKGESIRTAAIKFNVPRSTLHDRVTGKVKMGARRGPSSYLTIEEEDELANFLVRCAEIGYAHSLPQVLSLVQSMINSKGIQKMVTRGWWQKFCERHRELCHRTAVPLSVARAMATDQDVLDRYFEMLTETFSDNGLLNRPTQIYNCDETGIPLGATSLKVVAKVNSKPCSITSSDKTQVTVLSCVNAAGVALPPFVIFKRKTMNQELASGEVPGTLYGVSENGWITQQLFKEWFHRHFLAFVPNARPVVLLMDGHSTHYCPDTIRMAAACKVVLCTLPPHTTHLTQPLDKGCFAPLKMAWREVCQKFNCQNPGSVVGIYEFSHLFCNAWLQSMTMKNIVNGFKVTGVYPVDRYAIKLPSERSQTTFRPEHLAKESGLAYIPLYSPYRCITPNSSICHSTASFDDSRRSVTIERSLSEDNLSIGHLNSTSSHCLLPKQKASVCSVQLNTPVAPCKLPTRRIKSCGQVLTSAEFVEKMEELEKSKQEKVKEKEEKKLKRAKEREEKKLQQPQKAIRNKGKLQKVAKGKLPTTSKVTWKKPVSETRKILPDSSSESDCTFSHEEHKKFTKRHENGYDITTDQRYNKWLEIYHPTDFQSTNDLSFTNDDISGSLFENFSPCLESTPNVQKPKRSSERVTKNCGGLNYYVRSQKSVKGKESIKSSKGVAPAETTKKGTFVPIIATRSQKLSLATDSTKVNTSKALPAYAVKTKHTMIDDQNSLEPEYCEAEECYIDNCSLKDVQWIACDICSRWLHKYCCGLLEKANPKNFICDRHLQE